MKVTKEHALYFLNERGWPNPDSNFEEEMVETLIDFVAHVSESKKENKDQLSINFSKCKSSFWPKAESIFEFSELNSNEK